ncbi:hypothetical protein F5Y05DRAFT_407812 [Hypoxylon sp. FL0543]|nr:hypothetical protein F5Y05DRAFT_407812 [Hypoxylon sp. FL0543]
MAFAVPSAHVVVRIPQICLLVFRLGDQLECGLWKSYNRRLVFGRFPPPTPETKGSYSEITSLVRSVERFDNIAPSWGFFVHCTTYADQGLWERYISYLRSAVVTDIRDEDDKIKSTLEQILKKDPALDRRSLEEGARDIWALGRYSSWSEGFVAAPVLHLRQRRRAQAFRESDRREGGGSISLAEETAGECFHDEVVAIVIESVRDRWGRSSRFDEPDEEEELQWWWYVHALALGRDTLLVGFDEPLAQVIYG